MGAFKVILGVNWRWRWVVAALMLAAPLTLVVLNVATDDLSDRSYVVPLGNSVCLQRLGLDDSDRRAYGCGEFQLADAGGRDFNKWDQISAMHSDIWNVERIAVVGNRIIGKSGSGYFIYPKIFSSQEEYQAALAADGISSPALCAPAGMSAGLPARVIRPWAYTSMMGLFGRSDIWWSQAVIDAGILIAMLMGLCLPRAGARRIPVTMAIIFSMVVTGALLGFIANIIAYGEILSGGMDSSVGVFVLPPAFAFAVVWGMCVRKLIRRRPRFEMGGGLAKWRIPTV